MILATATIWFLIGPDAFNVTPGEMPPADVVLIQTGWWLVFLWPVTAISIRRAHDRGGSGWVVLLFQAINLLISAATIALPEDLYTQYQMIIGIFALALFPLGLFLLVTLGFLDGERRENRYGPSPKYDQGYRATP